MLSFISLYCLAFFFLSFLIFDFLLTFSPAFLRYLFFWEVIKFILRIIRYLCFLYRRVALTTITRRLYILKRILSICTNYWVFFEEPSMLRHWNSFYSKNVELKSITWNEKNNQYARTFLIVEITIITFICIWRFNFSTFFLF